MAPFLDLLAQNQSFKIEPIRPASSPTFLYTSNPIYRGTFAFKTLCESQEVGISLQNRHQSIFFAAHLCNALKQSELVKTYWLEMDELIKLHKTTWFSGQLPNIEDTISNRFCFCLGVSIQNLARNARNPDRNWKVIKGFENGLQLPQNKVAEIFKHYFDQTKPLSCCIHKVAMLSQ